MKKFLVIIMITNSAASCLADNSPRFANSCAVSEFGSVLPEVVIRAFQEVKDQKLREMICLRDIEGIKFWLEKGARLKNLTAKSSRNGLVKYGAWIEFDTDGAMILFIDTEREMISSEGLYQEMLDLLQRYGVNKIEFCLPESQF